MAAGAGGAAAGVLGRAAGAAAGKAAGRVVLAGGRRARAGNRVSEDGGNRTRRRWLPNFQPRRVRSEALGRDVPLLATTHALRGIRKKDGLDAYLLGTRDELLGSDKALRLKREVERAVAAAAESA